MRLPSVGQTFWQNLSSWKRWLRRTWGPKSENFHWKSLPRLTKLPNTEDLHKEQQEGRCTFRIPLKTKQCFSIWTATSKGLTLWHRMKSYVFQELWAPRCSFQEKKQTCLSGTSTLLLKGLNFRWTESLMLYSQLITSVCCLTLEMLLILLDVILSMSKDYRNQGWKCQSPFCSGCLHTQYIHSREQTLDRVTGARYRVQHDCAWGKMGQRQRQKVRWKQ